MDSFWKAVQDWPVLLQGVIGSAIFWLILVVGQRVMSLLSKQFSKYSRDLRTTAVRTELLRLHARKTTTYAEGGPYAALLLYRLARPLIMALMWLVLGLAFESLLGVLGVVGFFGCLVYLLAAYRVVRPAQIARADLDSQIAELQAKLTKLEEES
jgi:hypothetical protein